MRIKIAFLTVLVINVVGFAAYWLLHFLRIELMWYSHEYLNMVHKCPDDDVPIMGLALIAQICGSVVALLVGVGLWNLSKAVIIRLYKKIDSIFPERKKS